jgi:hypothetical protein
MLQAQLSGKEEMVVRSLEEGAMYHIDPLLGNGQETTPVAGAVDS